MHTIDKLKNGLTVVTRPMAHMESVSLGVWIRAGGRYEDMRTSGISHLLEHLLFKGTATRDTKKIKEEIEGRGGSFNGFTAEEFTCYLVKLLAHDVALGVDILSDMVFEPKLDETEIGKEKSVIIEEINMYKDMPSQHVHEVLAEMMWPGEPLGMPLAGRVESVSALTRADISAYKEKYYNPENMVLIGAGRIGDGELVALARTYFGARTGKGRPAFAKCIAHQEKKHISIAHKETEQTHVALGFHALNRSHPDRHVSSILNIILGANMSSRLFHTVRDEMALCYEISSGIRRYEDTGAFVVSAGVDHGKLVRALEVICGVLGATKRTPVPDEELRRAKEYYKGQLLFALEDTMSLMLWLGEKEIAGEKELEAKRIIEIIERVTADDLMRVARSLFTEANINLAVIGPGKDDRPLDAALTFA